MPVVVCSIAHESGELALAAMDAGAVEFVQKPTPLATARVYDVAEPPKPQEQADAPLTDSV